MSLFRLKDGEKSAGADPSDTNSESGLLQQLIEVENQAVAWRDEEIRKIEIYLRETRQAIEADARRSIEAYKKKQEMELEARLKQARAAADRIVRDYEIALGATRPDFAGFRRWILDRPRGDR